MNGVVRVHLIRHAESIWNVEGRYQGQQDSGLTLLGRAQAEQAGGALAARFETASVHASDSPRALDTARPLADLWRVRAQPDPRLRELDIGDWAGRTFREVRECDPATVAAFDAGADVPRGGGETLATATDRVMRALTDIADAAGDRDAAAFVFAHGGPIRLAVACVLGLEPRGMHALEPPGNCALTTLSRSAGQWRVASYNETVVSIDTHPTDEASGDQRTTDAHEEIDAWQ